MIKLAVAAFGMTLLWLPINSFAASCSRSMYDAVEKAISSLDVSPKSPQVPAQWWKKLKHTYDRYLRDGCDQGYVSEGASDVVCKLIARDWTHRTQLLALMKQNTQFAKFVGRHLDATCDWADLDEIVKNAGNECPTDYKSLCKDLVESASASSKEAKGVAQPKVKQRPTSR